MHLFSFACTLCACWLSGIIDYASIEEMFTASSQKIIAVKHS